METILELTATFCAGVFFGAAAYISIAQHPATLETGPSFGGQFLPPCIVEQHLCKLCWPS